jgi:hypothetical protein
MSLLDLIPDPKTFCVENVKVMNYLSWRVLSLATAGIKIRILGKKDVLGPRFVAPTPEDRARAAAVIRKALELLQAELADDARATSKNRDFKKVFQVKPLGEFAVALEGMLRLQLGGTISEILKAVALDDSPFSEDAAEMLSTVEAIRKDPKAIRELGIREQILAWHVLHCYETDPEYVFTQEDWDRLEKGLDEDRRTAR